MNYSKLATELQDTNLLRILSSAENADVIDTILMLKAGLPTTVESKQPWLSRNMQLQVSLHELDSRLYFLTVSKENSRTRYEGGLVYSGDYEDSGTKGERQAVMLHRDSEYMDMNSVINVLRSLSKFINGLLWSLKSMYSKVD